MKQIKVLCVCLYIFTAYARYTHALRCFVFDNHLGMLDSAIITGPKKPKWQRIKVPLINPFNSKFQKLWTKTKAQFSMIAKKTVQIQNNEKYFFPFLI